MRLRELSRVWGEGAFGTGVWIGAEGCYGGGSTPRASRLSPASPGRAASSGKRSSRMRTKSVEIEPKSVEPAVEAMGRFRASVQQTSDALRGPFLDAAAKIRRDQVSDDESVVTERQPPAEA